MKVIFLDIDGVLNSRRSCCAFGNFPHGYTPEQLAKFDWVAVGLVRKACAQSGAQIVLSSAWRKIYDWQEGAKALTLPIIDKTPSMTGIRGLEINAWLAAHPEVTGYAIIDDNSDMLPEQMANFVHTDERDGFLLKDYERLLNILAAERSVPA